MSDDICAELAVGITDSEKNIQRKKVFNDQTKKIKILESKNKNLNETATKAIVKLEQANEEIKSLVEKDKVSEYETSCLIEIILSKSSHEHLYFVNNIDSLMKSRFFQTLYADKSDLELKVNECRDLEAECKETVWNANNATAAGIYVCGEVKSCVCIAYEYIWALYDL